MYGTWKKLKAVPAEALTELAQTDELELIYLHLQSMRNFNHARDRLVMIPDGRSEVEASPIKDEESTDKDVKAKMM